MERQNESALVSVVMAVHNGEAFLAEAVRSIQGQLLQNFELVVVDDGSSDGTSFLLSRLAQLDSRLRLVRNASRQGLSRSLNLALSLARGGYVARLDADDVAHPERLQKQAAVLDQCRNIAVVGSWLQEIDATGAPLKMRKGALHDFVDYLVELLQGNNWLYHPAVMFRREVVESLGGYEESFDTAQDFELWTRLALSGYSGHVIPQALTDYRVHPGQVSATRRLCQAAAKQRAHYAFLESLFGEICGQDVALAQLAAYFRGKDSWIAEMERTGAGGAERVLGQLPPALTKRYVFSRREAGRLKAAFARIALARSYRALVLGHKPLGRRLLGFAVREHPGVLADRLALKGVWRCLSD